LHRIARSSLCTGIVSLVADIRAEIERMRVQIKRQQCDILDLQGPVDNPFGTRLSPMS
jgi:hypothetical protein